MTVETKGPNAPFIIERVMNLITKPAAEWDRIDAEAGSIKGIYIGYVCLLAAIGPIASLIGSQVFPVNVLGFVYRAPIISSVMIAVISYIAQLAGVFITALIMDALAPNFGGQKDQLKAFKVAAYSMTAAWIAGVFGILPMLAWLGIVGLYSLYLFWLGAPKLMRVPADKAVGYVIVTILIAIVVNAVIIGVISTATAMTAGVGRMGGIAAASGPGSISFHNGNGSASINLGQLAAAANAAGAQMKAQAAASQAAANGQPGAVAPVTPIASDVLSGMLPASLSGYSRGDVSSSSGSAGGIGGSNAQATYTKAGSSITLSVTDMGGAGALTAMAGALNVNSNEQHGTSYKKVNTINGRIIAEDYDTQSRNGSYAITAGRFAVEAHGNSVDMNDLKAAVGSVPIDQLAAKAPH